MKITFNELGVVIETITNDEPLRQGNVGNSITATFNGKDNLYHMATLNFTRADGKTINDVVMKKDLENKEVFTKTFDSEFFFAVSGATTITIYLRNKSGEIVASGRIQFDIEESDYENKAPIDRDQYDELLAYIETKMPIITNVIELEYGEELPLPGETGTMYLVPKTNEKKVFERYWFSPYIDDYVYLGDTSLNLPQYQNRNEKGQANGYAPLDKDKYVPLTHLPGSFKELSKYPTYDDFPRPPASAIKNNLFVALDTRYEYVWLDELDDYLLLDESFSDAGSVNYDPVDSEGLKANNVKSALDELSKTKLNIKPLVWTTLPEGAVDKKTFYNKTIATLRTANSKIYMFGTPEETPIKEFFDIWGKPTDFKATHVYITIASVSNETKRDSFMMTIHSSNYSNMYFYIVNGYSSQMVGNGSGWVSYNLLSAERQKQLAKIDGYYELMVVGYALGLIDPEPSKPTIGTFATRETANGQEIENDTATIVNEIGGNTIVKNQLFNYVETPTREKNNIKVDYLGNGKYKVSTPSGASTAETKFSIHTGRLNLVKDHYYYLCGCPASQGWNKSVLLDINEGRLYNDKGNGSITQANVSSSDAQIMINCWANQTFNNVIFTPRLVDLTIWFGAGNEPTSTSDERIAIVKEIIYKLANYDIGTLMSATPKALTSIGKNLCNQNIKFGEYNYQGVLSPNSKNAVITDFIEIIRDKKIFISQYDTTNISLDRYLFEFDENKNFIKRDDIYGSVEKSLTLQPETKYVIIQWFLTTPNVMPAIKIMLSFASSNEFVEYQVDTLTTEFENYATEMRGVNNIRDTLTKKTYTKRFGIVDLGEKTWKASSLSDKHFYAVLDEDIKLSKGSTQVCNDIASNGYEVIIFYDFSTSTPKKDKIIAQYSNEKKIGIYDTAFAGKTPEQVKSALSGVMLVYELKTPVITPINPERAMAYKVQNHGIESWDSEVPVYTNIVYAHNLANKLKSLRSFEEQKNKDDTQDSRLTALENTESVQNQKIADLESDSLHFSPEIHDLIDNKANRVELSAYTHKYHYIGNIHDIELYNQLLAVDDIAKGALFSVEIANDTTKAELNKGFPNLKQGSMVYGWFTQDELGQPMNIITEKGMFKVIDGGTLTCEVIDGEDFDIEYRVASQHQFNISTPQLAHLIKGLRVWYQYEFQGRKRLQHQDIYFTDKGDTDATSYISNGLNIVGFLADTIAIEFDMSTGVIALRSTGTMPQTFKLIDLKGLR